MDRGDAGHDDRPGRDAVSPQLDVAGQLAHDVDDHRPDAQRLLDRRVEVLVALVQRLCQPVEDPRVPEQALEGPGQRRGGGLVAGADHGHQLVAQLLIAQQREHVVAVCEVGLGPAQCDLLVQEVVHRGPGPFELGPGSPRAELATQERKQRDQVGAPSELVYQRAQPIEALALADAEYRPEDHFEGDPLRMRAQRELLAHRPGLEVALGDVPDRGFPALHVLAVERREQQLALAQMGLLVQREHGVGADAWLQRPGRGLAGVEHARVAGEHLLDQLGIGHVDHPPEAGEPGPGQASVAPVERSDAAQWVEHEVQPADRCRGNARAGGQAACAHGANVPQARRTRGASSSSSVPAAARAARSATARVRSPRRGPAGALGAASA